MKWLIFNVGYLFIFPRLGLWL